MERIGFIMVLLLVVASTGSSSRFLGLRDLPHFNHLTNGGNYNVRDYGAVGDGETDDSKAFLEAWEDVCHGSQGGTATLVVPNSVFLLSPVLFQGPCNSANVNFQILGTIVAPADIEGYGGQTSTWIHFSQVNGLTINGGGAFDGKGSIWWNRGVAQRPTAIRFHACNDLRVSGTRHLNSQRNHISINECQGADLSVDIQAPADSPNTDGIDISDSSHLLIHDSAISTGDDCIAINSKTSYTNITSVRCGPGHGISIGSLGEGGAQDTVEHIYVRNCSLVGTQNGVRIKTWQGWTGYARDITFEDITLHASQNPIVINQHYDNHLYTGLWYGSASAQISDITYRRIVGTSADAKAINFDCASCTNIVVDMIDITASEPNMNVFASCNNAQGTEVSANPPVPCLAKQPTVWIPSH